MEQIKAFICQYWPNFLAFGIFLAALARYVHLGEWEQHLLPFAYAAFGFVCVIASDEVAEWTGRYGWTREQWWQCPPNLIRSAGGLALTIGTIQLYRS